MRKIFSIIFLLYMIVNISYASQIDGEYSYSDFKIGKQTLQGYYNLKSAPNIYISRKCSKGNHPVCWPVVKNQNGKILASYGEKDSVGAIAKGRYQNIAYLYYTHSYKRGKKYYTNYYFIDQTGKKYNQPAIAMGSLARNITIDGNILDITQNGIYLNNNIQLRSNDKLTHAKIVNNLSGDQSIIVITSKHKVKISNTTSWIDTNLTLSKKGDRKGILGVYPKNSHEIVYSVYKYTNSYNKGLVLGRVNFNNNENFYGWLFNSELRNVGFDPEIYIQDDQIIISVKDSSNRTNLYTTIPNNNKLKDIVEHKPKHIEGFEDEKNFSFLIGTSLSKISWEATNEVKDEDDNSYGKVEYDIADSLYKSIYLQGKIGDTQIAISHLKNEAEAKGGVTKKASQFTSAVIDIDGFFSPQSSLRIISEKGEVNGLATWKDSNGNIGIDINGNYVENLPIETSMDRLSFFIMKERGFYHGIDYTKYTMPSLLGFSKDGDIKFTIFDPEAEIQKITYNWGYDELSYAKRYENNFSRLYIQGLFGIGLAYINMSDNGDLADQMAENKGYDSTDEPITFAVDYALDIGYIIQKKSKTLLGAGFSTQIGYKIKGTYYTAGTSSNSDSEDNSLSLDLERNDIWHGPYISFNLIF